MELTKNQGSSIICAEYLHQMLATCKSLLNRSTRKDIHPEIEIRFEINSTRLTVNELRVYSASKLSKLNDSNDVSK